LDGKLERALRHAEKGVGEKRKRDEIASDKGSDEMDGIDDEEGEEDMEDDISVEDDGLLTKAELHHVKEESKRALGEKLKRLKRDDDDELKLIVKESNKSKQA